MPPLYLTPRRYATMGQGTDLSGIEDQDLASQILTASGMVNAHCAVAIDHDFRGGTVTAEPHQWQLGNHMWPGPGRVFPERSPLKTLTSFQIHVTNTQFLDVDTSYVHYDKSRNSLEPVIAAAAIGVWSYGVIPVAGYRTPEARISYTYGDEFSVTDEQMFPDGGHVWRAQNQWWTTADVTVKINGSTVVSGITIDRNEGTVAIDDDVTVDPDVAVDEVDSVTVSYTHKLHPNIMMATAILTTSLLGQRNIVASGLQGLSGIRVEEVEIRQSRDAQAARDQIPGVVQALLGPFRRMHWG